jgi:hypothetical protein
MIIWKLLRKIEYRVRGWLSRHPIFYALYGGTGLVLFERGVWHGIDALSEFLGTPVGMTSRDAVVSFQDSGVSFLLGVVILLSSGIFVSQFIGNEIIMSGLRGEKRLTERTETEVRTETGALAEVLTKLDAIASRLEAIEEGHHKE